jgi:hypothetical protein
MREHAWLAAILVFGMSWCAARASAPVPVAALAAPGSHADSISTRSNRRGGGAPGADSLAAAANTATIDTQLQHSVAALDSSLAHLTAVRDSLRAPDRRVLDEMLAGARELFDSGDVDAAQLMAADALDFVRQRHP